jgi:hypothetical protein
MPQTGYLDVCERRKVVRSTMLSSIVIVAAGLIGSSLAAETQQVISQYASQDNVSHLSDTFDKLLSADIPASIKQAAAEAVSAHRPLLTETPELRHVLEKARRDGLLQSSPWDNLGPGRSSVDQSGLPQSVRVHSVEKLQEEISQQSPSFKNAVFDCREDLQLCRVRNYGWLDCELIMITCLFDILLD